jgi:hypothetical protein
VRVIGGRYRLLAELDSGGFGRVWKAYDEQLRVDVAVKEVLFPPELTATARSKLLERARREARNAAKLRDNPHVVAVHDIVMEGGVPWLIMRLVEGRSLAKRLSEQGRLPAGEAGHIATGLLQALRAAHAANIVHRDIKPANLPCSLAQKSQSLGLEPKLPSMASVKPVTTADRVAVAILAWLLGITLAMIVVILVVLYHRTGRSRTPSAGKAACLATRHRSASAAACTTFLIPA